jgi:hypothetical protein
MLNALNLPKSTAEKVCVLFFFVLEKSNGQVRAASDDYGEKVSMA